MKKKAKKTRVLSLRVLVVVMVLSLAMPLQAFASVAGLQVDGTKPGKSLAGTYPALDVDVEISLAEAATQNVEIDVAGMTKENLEKAVDDNEIELSLTRNKDRAYIRTDLFPNMKDGGSLDSWKTQKSSGDEKLFSTKLSVSEDGKLVVSLTNKTYYYDRSGKPDISAPHSNGGAYLDLCGYFDLKATINDKSGSADAKIVPYGGFRTVYELADDIDAVAKADTKYYVSKESAGQTTIDGYDMPYLVIAKDKADVDRWLAYTDEVETNPEAVLEELKKPNGGKYADMAVPMMASNCHSNENAAVNGIINFAEMIVAGKDVDYKTLEGFTEAGQKLLEEEMARDGKSTPALIKDHVSQVGRIRGNATGLSEHLDLETYYNVKNNTANIDELLDDVFLIVVPEQNMEGYEHQTRTPSSGYDINRDEANQTMNEDANLMAVVNKWNPMVFTEIHGRVTGVLIEPCTPPHEPNYEYDLIGIQFVQLGEAVGMGAIANCDNYNSFELPFRDYLGVNEKSPSGVEWTEPWDDMTTAYGSQFPVLIGTAGITWELPAYNEETSTKMVPYGLLVQAKYIQKNRINMLTTQATLFKRGVNNENSDAAVAPWYVNQYDQSVKEQADLMRPKNEGNGQYYPECYIIPMDKDNQVNLLEAAEDVKYLSRNDVKVTVAEKEFTYNGVTYPAGTVMIPMYQAKRSIANSQLSDGTFISVWKGLYSESFAQRSRARGYDRIKVDSPEAYKTIAAACTKTVDYEGVFKFLEGVKSQLSGVKNADVIIENASEDSSAAVVELLNADKTVGIITDGKDKGDFICSYEDYMSVADKYILSATGVNGKNVKAKVLTRAPKVYIAGKPAKNTSGYVDSSLNASSYNYKFDSYALKAMGITQTESATKADLIVNSMSNSLTAVALEAVKEGTAYLGHGSKGTAAVKSLVPGISTKKCVYGTDMLGVVEYPNQTFTNSNYVNENDTIMYQYGTYFFNGLPETAKVIVKNAGKTPLQGCIGLFDDDLKAEFEAYNTAPIGIEYAEGDLDITLFSNPLTYKAHSQDEFQFISNAAFAQVMGTKDYAGKADPAEAVDTSIELMATGVQDTVVLEWVVEGAELDGFQVLKGTKDGKMSVIATTEENTYTVEGLTGSSSYYYQIKGYKVVDGKKLYVTSDRVYKKSEVAAVKTTTITAKYKKSGKTVTLSWTKKGADVDGYMVYKYNSKTKKYVKVATTTKKSYKTTLKKGTYKFKVKGFAKFDGKAYYTKWSNVKTVKIK